VSKTIIFCADGTWNGPDQDADRDEVPDPTNVCKLYQNLDGTDSPENDRSGREQERSLDAGAGPQQIAKYLHGVGDWNNFIAKALGGTLGAGLVARIVRGYTFVSRNYEPGDRIFLVGFSRGAYTARALAGLIVEKGVLDRTAIDLEDKILAYRLGSAVWYDLRRQVLKSERNWRAALQEFAIGVPGFLSRAPTSELVPAGVEAVAVWDTVGALGIPDYARVEGERRGQRLDAFQFANRKLGDKVRHGLHAVAIDERRSDFTPTLWDDRAGVTQALFAGAHADVGGGYPSKNRESGLADCALKWMMDELAKLGVKYSAALTHSPAPDPAGVAHEPWTHAPFNKLGVLAREFAPGLVLHRSVLDRLKAGAVAPDPRRPPAPYSAGNMSKYILAGEPVRGVTIAA
jgi:uncharacterized protein (DUF2235 family)